MSRYDLFSCLPLWIRYLPICLSVLFSVAATAIMLICRTKRKSDGFLTVFLLLDLVLQIFHFVFIEKFGILFVLAVIIFTITLTLYGILHYKQEIRFFAQLCTVAFYLLLGYVHSEMRWIMLCGLVVLVPYFVGSIVYLFDKKSGD